MVLDKLLIDRFAATKTLVNAVPELNAGLAQLPAKIDLLAVELSGEVDETDIQILHDASVLVDFFKRLLQLVCERLAPLFLFPHLGKIHQHASEHGDAVREVLPVVFGLLIFGFERDRIPNRGFHLRK